MRDFTPSWLSGGGFSLIRRTATLCWLLLSLLVASLLGIASKQGLVFETDLQALMPRSDRSELAQQAGQRLFDFGGDNILLVIAAPAQAEALAAAESVQKRLQQSPLLVVESLDERGKQVLGLLQLYAEHRFHLLSEQQQQSLARGEVAPLTQLALRELYGPGNWSRTIPVAEDPLNLLQGFQESLQVDPRAPQLVGEHLVLPSAEQADRSHVLLLARSRDSVLNLQTQRAVNELIVSIEGQLSRDYPHSQLLRSGIVFHAAAAAQQARREISLIGGGSTIGIVLLFIATFASLRPLLLSLASVLYGSLCAFALCHVAFGSVHLLTLVFGASLIGVAIDYSLHYFTRLHGAGGATGSSALRGIFPGLLLALVTTVIGYSSLAQAPLPGLRQIAVFSVAGLVSAWLFVVVIYPLTAAPLARSYPPQLLALAALPWNAWQRLNRRQTIALISLLSSVCLGICLLALQSADDARALYRPSPTLLAQERQLQALAPGYSPNQFFLITGADIEAVLQREERLQVVLDQLRKDGAISQWNGVSRYLPSVARQQRNYQLLQRHVYGESGAAWPLMASLGLDAASQTELRQAFVTARGRYLLAEDWLPGAGAELKLLWLGRRNGRYASMVTLRGVADLAALNSAAEQIEGVVFVDRVAQISALLSTQRDAAGILLGLAYGCVMLLLLLVYRHPSALILALIPLLATLISVSMLALTGVPLSIFHVFALFLVLGLGMDYSIFARQGAPRDSDCRLAILLSALTSCLSFGLLALSSTPMVQAFGSTVLMGSMLNLLLVPLVDTLRGSGTP